jgi:cell division protein FtsQ
MRTWQKIGIGVLIAILLALLALVMFQFSGKEDERICNQIVVKIKDQDQLQFIDEAKVLKILQRSGLKLRGEKVKDLKISEIKDVLLSTSMIKQADCYVTPSGDLNIDIWQREPVFRVIATPGYYVDAEGKIMDISSDFVVYVPVVTGAVSQKMATGDLLQFILFLQKNDFWNAQIEQIDVTPSKEIVLIPRVGDHEIELGTLDNYESKLKKLEIFYLKGLNKIGWGDYKTISLKYKDQVVCTKNRE